MPFTATANFSYDVDEESTFFFNFLVSSQGRQKLISEELNISPETAKVEEFASEIGQERTLRVVMPPGKLEIEYTAEVEISPKQIQIESLKDTPICAFDGTLLPYIFPSRYCPSDRLRLVAGELFGHCESPLETATAISDWIFENVSYVTGVTYEQTAADEVFELRQGVCRDFAHLGISLCRALNIPARYVSVYAWNLDPMDFHACFEAWIGGQWIIFDPTHMSALNALIRIASGPDAAYVAVATIFGNATGFSLSNNCVSNSDFEAEVRGSLAEKNEVISII